MPIVGEWSIFRPDFQQSAVPTSMFLTRASRTGQALHEIGLHRKLRWGFAQMIGCALAPYHLIRGAPANSMVLSMISRTVLLTGDERWQAPASYFQAQKQLRKCN